MAQLICSYVAVVFVFNSKLKTDTAIIVLIVSVIVGIIGFFAFFRKDISEIKNVFKNKIIHEMIRYIDKSLLYSPTGFIQQYEYLESKLFLTQPQRYSGEDIVAGKLKDTQIKFSEIHSEYYTKDKKGNKTWHTIFRGLFFIADFNKHFKGETVVLPDTAEKLFGSFGSFFQKMNVSRNQLIKLEDPEFEKEFAVYGTDQIEARYILSTKLMRRILDFKNKAGKKVYLSFTNSKLFVAVPVNRNLFEAPFFSSMIDFELIAEYYRYIELMVGIVEELDLNTRIWTKE
jgi:hypothetical protein